MDTYKEELEFYKGSVELCKDSEFYYLCVDCRTYTEKTRKNKGGLNISNPLK